MKLSHELGTATLTQSACYKGFANADQTWSFEDFAICSACFWILITLSPKVCADLLSTVHFCTRSENEQSVTKKLWAQRTNKPGKNAQYI